MEEINEVNVTAAMEDLGIRKIERIINRYLVVLNDNRMGIGASVGEAFKKAQQPDAANAGRVSA